MKTPALLFLLILFHTSSCSDAARVNNTVTSDVNRPRAVENQSPGNVSDQSSQTVEWSPSRNPKDVVVFDGKNYIKKSGWKVPPRKHSYKDETYESDLERRTTESGKRVITTTIEYIYKTPWLYSQDFYFEGGGLESMKGQLESASFLEMSANGKVFFYSVFTQKVLSPPPSNNDSHEDPFRYKIMDANGDGIFETLLGDYDEIIVPNWVLK
jgi:hypothetical protein